MQVVDRSGDEWERELLESTPPADDGDGCRECWRRVQTWQWPLDRRPQLCRRCWLARIRGDVTRRLLCGELVVWTQHPQRGRMLRGAVRPTGCGPQVAIRWQLTGPRHRDLGTYTGDYVDAEARLLEATAELDTLDE